MVSLYLLYYHTKPRALNIVHAKVFTICQSDMSSGLPYCDIFCRNYYITNSAAISAI